MPRKRTVLYTEGQLNKMIDSLFHPIAHRDPYYWLADTILHALVEQDPSVTVGKFMRYTAPKIIQQAVRRRRTTCFM